MVAALTRGRIRQTMMESIGCGKLTQIGLRRTFTFLVPVPSFSPFPRGGFEF